jgi:hypothetical protein
MWQYYAAACGCHKFKISQLVACHEEDNTSYSKSDAGNVEMGAGPPFSDLEENIVGRGVVGGGGVFTSEETWIYNRREVGRVHLNPNSRNSKLSTEKPTPLH